MTTFSSSKSIVAAVALAVMAPAGLNATTGHAGEFSSATVVKPKAGLSFPVGSKQAVGYFLAERGGCDLTLLVGEAGEAASEANKVAALLHDLARLWRQAARRASILRTGLRSNSSARRGLRS